MTNAPPEPFFGGRGIDRADAVRSDPIAIAAMAASARARELQWEAGLPKVSQDGRLAWSVPANPELFLGLADGSPCFSPIENVTVDARAAFPRLTMLDDQDAPLFAAALSLSRWHARHRFCANCGSHTQVIRGGWSRRCPCCEAEHFPRVDPVVIMLAEHDGKLLLGRQPQYPPRRYSALAGFVEVGETVEAAVERELLEEVGIEVGSVRYVASQPWPFPWSLMLGCHAHALHSSLTIDRTELEDARWFTREEVAAALDRAGDAPFEAPPATAMAHTLLQRWLALELAKTRP